MSVDLVTHRERIPVRDARTGRITRVAEHEWTEPRSEHAKHRDTADAPERASAIGELEDRIRRLDAECDGLRETVHVQKGRADMRDEQLAEVYARLEQTQARLLKTETERNDARPPLEVWVLPDPRDGETAAAYVASLATIQNERRELAVVDGGVGDDRLFWVLKEAGS